LTTQDIYRKLAAILSADVKGYSRLMGEDEVGTIRTLNADFAKTLPYKDHKDQKAVKHPAALLRGI
jgi:hypothetical protein